MFEAPVGESVEGRNESAAIIRKAILGRKHSALMKFTTRNNAVGLEIAEMLREHLLRNAGYVAPQVAEAAWPFADLAEDRRLPLTGDNGDRGCNRAFGVPLDDDFVDQSQLPAHGANLLVRSYPLVSHCQAGFSSPTSNKCNIGTEKRIWREPSPSGSR